MPAPPKTRGRAPAPRTAKRKTRPSRGVILWSALAFCVVAALCFIAVGALERSSPRGPQGLFDVIDGKPYPVDSATGGLTLLSFLVTQPDAANTPSRNQAVVLTSLSTQYHGAGLNVAIVDESPGSPGTEALANTAYDWQLGGVAMLEDPGHRAAERYGVTSAPATYLISSTGTVLAHWTGYVLTSTAAASITAHLHQGPLS